MSLTSTATLTDILEPCYGPTVAQQIARYEEALTDFHALYGSGPVQLFRAPGRVNVIGEHTDYNHGFVLPAALDKDVVILARPRSDRTLRVANVEDAYAPLEFELADEIAPAPRGHWSNYLRGPAQMLARQADLPGCDLLVAGAPPHGVPRSVGLSSSSAVVVATAVTLAHQVGLPHATAAFAQSCADAEWYVGTRGGIMDHFAALLTRRDHALFLDCRASPDGSYLTRHIPFPPSHRLLVVDSGVHHDNIRGEFNMRVAACRAGVALLQAAYPHITHLRDVQDVPWLSLAPYLPEVTTARQLTQTGIELGDIPGLEPDAPLHVLRNCRHVWHENARVLQTLDALAAGDTSAVGALLTAAHLSARDDYAISTTELDFLVNSAISLPGVAGARLTGAGWGGCMLIMVDAGAVEAVQAQLGAAYAARFDHPPAMFICQAAPGAAYLGTLNQ
ncbi:MAG: galactokinase [Caldilineaceae bacterium]|nr:galactokinase [Caldilineaceae bacterium]